MSDHELIIDDLNNFKLNHLPTLEEQQKAVEEIESMIAQGVDLEKALEAVFAQSKQTKQ